MISITKQIKVNVFLWVFFAISLALANDTTLMIGTIDEIQKLHIRTVPLGESPHRIAYQEATQTFGVITMRTELKDATGAGTMPVRQSASTTALNMSSSTNMKGLPGQSGAEGSHIGDEIELHSLLVIDQHTFEGKQIKTKQKISRLNISTPSESSYMLHLYHRSFFVGKQFATGIYLYLKIFCCLQSFVAGKKSILCAWKKGVESDTLLPCTRQQQ